MPRRNLEDQYFDWMYDIVCGDRFADDFSYSKLLSHLHDIEFTYSVRLDSNRAKDGVNLRRKYAYETRFDDDILEYITGPCSVLEMILALAIRCETEIMNNPRYGDRTGQWFWQMITNLGLSSMVDSRYDMFYVESIIATFLNRDYEPDGRGGLFTIKNCEHDLRNVEIWHQMLWMTNGIT